MAEVLTEQQKQAVFDRGGKLLVSAAAGSGKTKVLVDRIMSYLKDPIMPANLDEFLIITFTKAAASELRGKIAAKLSQEIAADPSNRHLKKQMQRLYLAKISTVHSYCADILRENAFHLDIPADFRMAEESECEEMQHIVIEKVLDDVYKNIYNDGDLCAFVDTQGFGRNDRQLPEIVLKLYKNSRCHMDPDGWLDWCINVFDTAEINDLSETPWAKYLINDLHHYLDLQIDALSNCAVQAQNADGMEKPIALLYSTIDQLRELKACNRWDDIVAHADIAFGSLNFPRKNFDVDAAEKIKVVRNNCKSGVTSKLKRFTDCGDQVLTDVAATAASARGLIAITRLFTAEYDKLKRRLRVLDFGDLEQKALDLLMGKNRRGPTMIAVEISKRFREIMVDEYQDTNEVQDAIFSALTKQNQNCFMVGDVKQSIYQFRRADPEIFLDKYNKYLPAGSAQSGEGRKVMLSSNFRSSGGVIDAVNDVFTVCMSKHVGGLKYGKDEKLYEGIAHETLGEPEVELYAIVADESTYDTEPAFVAKRVLELLDGKHMVRDKNGLRPVRPGDIAILLRSPGSVGTYYIDELERVGLRCWFGNSVNLLETEEVQAVRSVLQILDNPLQDIPLIAVLSSKLFGFTADDLSLVRCAKQKCSFYEALLADTSEKSQKFVGLLQSLRAKARSSTLLGLIKYIFTLTKVDSIFAAMPDGESRIDNLLGFYKVAADFEAHGGKSLSAFLSRLDSLEKRGISVETEGAGEDAITITSIHKSKGLEYPVVILPALSRKFNTENAYDSLLCDKDLGIGLSCVDTKNRVRYPSVSKHAISAKILSDSLSEEMRILYVAMTRARDRLIMTYTSPKLEKTLNDIAVRMECSDPELLTCNVGCMGDWVLISAMSRSDAGALFAVSSRPSALTNSNSPWLIKVINESVEVETSGEVLIPKIVSISDAAVSKIQKSLRYRYPFSAATMTPSKLTATQVKGRDKDNEALEATDTSLQYAKSFRSPSFSDKHGNGLKRGNAVHAVMQHICYSACSSISNVTEEINRIVNEGYIDREQADLVDPAKILQFFMSDIGKTLIEAKQVLREFKFSILEDAAKYNSSVAGEEILLQGVVDCAILDDYGITVIDFKTDKVNSNNVFSAAERYEPQIRAYADALERIYKKPVKSVALYFFEIGETITM